MTNYLYVTEFAEIARPEPGFAPWAKQPPLAEQCITMSATSAQSAAFNVSTRFVRLHTDGVIAIEFGTNPTAVAAGGTGTARMAANTTEYFGVPAATQYEVLAPGASVTEGYKVAGVVST